MKTVLLAGGLGTRLSEKTDDTPKPMVEIGNRPILHHIMQIYSNHGFNEFVVALGYKAEVVREYFLHFYALNSDLTVDLGSGKTTVHQQKRTPWKVHLVDTGLNTLTAGRMKQLESWIGNETFMMTYGDGVSDVNIRELADFHKSHGKLATVLAVRPPSRFGELIFDKQQITSFKEKPLTESGWVNGGFFVLEPEVFSYINKDEMWEQTPLQRLAEEGELMGFHHEGFWQPMDTLRDCRLLQKLWNSGEAPWAMQANAFS
ncbi:MAG: Glucose-1-phosphate cytidylyltransferase [Chlamydiales bacterium]|nr:Glucose-1-phosphate cytidylyltransferase [Chlamydiales bacterium]MCH9635416.1 Glucose-1-phosphate cytidylyltransferase [Chlamydiales bacterium]MCH9703319.1 glucose-1-phosphate cytidylyltransferase [Chlamydiota bacterium]